jgi:iron complex outermembrane receptor protein
MQDLAKRNLRLALLGGVAALLTVGGAAAQTAVPSPNDQPTYDEDATEVEALMVTAIARQPGAVIGDIPPELQFTPGAIQALGVSSVSDLIDALSTQLTSGQSRESGGRPVILVNGVRVSSFNEIRDVPSEAILRADILPEEVALKYGYPADQRVMNLVLRPRFRAILAEGGYRSSTDFEGGDTTDVHANLFTVFDGKRLLIDAKASGQRQLIESDLDIAVPRTDAGFRTLVPEQQTSALNFALTRPIKEGLAATINGTVETTNTNSRLGVNTLTLADPLRRESNSITGHLGGTLVGSVGLWRWTATANIDRSDSESNTQRVIGGLAYLDTTDAVSTSADGQFQVNRSAFRLPAGQVSTTLTASAESLNFKTNSMRANIATQGELSRDTFTGKANIDVPVFKRGRFGPEILGDVSLNFNASVADLSDFGTLNTIGAGVNWSPISKLRFIASYAAEETPPTVQQIGNPVSVTQGLQAYDFNRGETAIISRIEGGNTTLKADSRDVIKLGMNLKPFDKLDLNFQANYVYTHIDDPIAAFPTATSQIEAAFPSRFTRDASGRLASIDARPINFDERTTEQLRYGFNLRMPFGPQPPARPAGGFQGRGGAAAAGAAGGGQAPGAAGAPGAQGGGAAGGQRAQGAGAAQGPGGVPAAAGGPPPGAGGRGAPPGGGTLQLGVFHTIKFQDEITIRPGLAKLDLLDGAAIGNSGGVARNQLDVMGNINRRGLGANVNVRWTEGTKILGSGAVGSRDLYFSDRTTVNLRLFAELRQQPWFRDRPFFRGARASIGIDNLFDQKQTVRDGLGATPQTYQPDYLDPQGRTIRFTFRKLFGVPAGPGGGGGGFRGGGGGFGPPGGGR